MPTIQNRRATAAQWTAANPVLAAGEIGFELDTNSVKIGDGLTSWKTLPYLSDESLSELVETGRLSEAALNDTYAPFGSASRPSARAVVIGCSIENLHSYRTSAATSASEQFGGGDWPTWAMLLSSGRFHLVRNMGTGGQTTAQYLARFDTDVAPSVGRDTHDQANVVVIGGLENDIQQPTYSLESSRANIVEMVNRTRSLGAVPILRTTMSHFLSAAVRTKIGAANQWIRNYGVEQGIIVLDFWRLVVDPALRGCAATASLPVGSASAAEATQSSPVTGHLMAGVTGALPATFTRTASALAPALVVLRAA